MNDFFGNSNIPRSPQSAIRKNLKKSAGIILKI